MLRSNKKAGIRVCRLHRSKVQHFYISDTSAQGSDTQGTYLSSSEGRLSLLKTLRKKLYYAKKFAKYTRKNKTEKNIQNQTSIISRYWIFLSQPKKLLKNPLLGLGMLFMKTCKFEFGGLGMVVSKIKGK